MYSLKDAEPVIKYDILTTWLVERLENEEKIDRDELERLLSSLGIGVEHKTYELKENNKMIDLKCGDCLELMKE